MSGFYIGLALLPLLTGYGVIRGINYSATQKNSARNISPSYFAAIALLFALFASLIFGEVWNRVSIINSMMLRQASSLRAILRITEQLPKAAEPYRIAVDEYIKGIGRMEQQGNGNGNGEKPGDERKSFSNQTFHPIYGLATDSSLFSGDPVLQQAVLAQTEVLRNAWFERKVLLNQRVLPEKLLILFLMGFFTQVSIAFSHLGNNRATHDTVWLFSLVFFAALSILIAVDDTAVSRHFISLAALKDVF
ncbi:MAG: hypothetical protein ACKO6K_03045 [Chitinophagaceae bacterium]